MKRKGLLIMALFSLLCGCGHRGDGLIGTDGLGKKAVPNESGLKRFDYTYSNPFGASSYNFIVSRTDGGAELTYDAMQVESLGTMTMAVDPVVLDQLYDSYLNHNIAAWEGYSKSDPNVLDGDGFSLSLAFNDGARMTASGSNAAPDGYWEFLSEVHAIIDPLLKECVEDARQKHIAQGIPGPLQSIFVYFKQRGDSGSDEYQIQMSLQNGIAENVSAIVYSDSGEFIEPGEYRWNGSVPDDQLVLSEIQTLLEKYEINQWYLYDEAAEDYQNAEWFQLSFGFENDSISAMGTEPPEHYAEFRRDLLSLLISWLRQSQIDHPEFWEAE